MNILLFTRGIVAGIVAVQTGVSIKKALEAMMATHPPLADEPTEEGVAQWIKDAFHYAEGEHHE